MKNYTYPKRENWEEIVKRPTLKSQDLEKIIQSVFNSVKKEGDKALIDLTLNYDGARLSNLLVSENELLQSKNGVAQELKYAIRIAANNIKKFHTSQIEKVKKIETSKGVVCWRESRAIDKVGIYIPGGSAPLFSTLLMLLIPAKIAGCKNIVVCTPPDKSGKINPVILFVANYLGIKNVYKIGGAQAIAAMTFGTETIPAVSKIFGPGNQYVTAAKQYAQQFGIAIDMPAGPSELLIIADEKADASFVVSDLLSQAEHGEDSQVVLVSNSQKLIDKVFKELPLQLNKIPRKNTAAKSLENSFSVLLKDLETCISFSNCYAPEHLIISTKNAIQYSKKVVNAGSVFIGKYACESAGDYASGTNHTLPTNGFAKNYSGVSVDSFVRKITFQEISKKGILNIGPIIEKMAEAEQLIAHKNAVSIRLKKIRK